MKPYIAGLVNAILLITLGIWGYFASDNPSPTTFIPIGVGVILLFLNPGVRKENKVIAHIAVTLTLLILIGLIRPLYKAIIEGRNMGVMRVGLMLLSTILALVTFVKSFVDARKNR